MSHQFNRRLCRNLHTLSQAAFLGMLPSSLDNNGNETLNPRKLFESLEDDEWEVLTFNPDIREVCLVIHANSGDRNVTISIPASAFSASVRNN